MIAEHITEFRHHCFFCKINHDKEKLLYHKSTHIVGEDLYDFCMVDFEYNMCPSHIHGYFPMRFSSVPTNKLEEGRIEAFYDKNLVDNSTYAIAHASKEYMRYNNLQKSLVGNFLIGGDERHH